MVINLKKTFTAIIVLVSLLNGAVLFQLDSKGGVVLSEEVSDSGGLGDSGSYIDHRLSLRTDVGENGYFRFLERFEGAPVTEQALDEKILPLNHNFSAGFGGHHKVGWYIGICNDLFINADNLVVPWYPLGASIKPKALSGILASIKTTGKVFKNDFYLEYMRLNYDYISETGKNIQSVDDDLWGILDAEFSKLDLLDIRGKALFKADLNTKNAYDFEDIRLGAGKNYDLKIGRKRFYLSWELLARALISESLYLQKKAHGYSAEVRVSPMLRVKNGLYLIGVAQLEYGEDYQKQHYRLALRKSWKKLSRLLISFQGDFGCVIPRVIGDLSVTAKIKRLEITPKLDCCWRINTDENMEYYRTDAMLEFAVETFKKVEFTASCQFNAFQNNMPYTDRLAFYIGVKR